MSKKIISNLVLFFFLLLVGVASLFSDMFQNPAKTGPQVIEQAKLFTATDLKGLKKFTLKNKSGEFVFERAENNQLSPWHMTAPRDISANSVFMDKLFNSLMSIKIKKIVPEEKGNAANYSLDKPGATLVLIDEAGKTMIVNLGLMNTIDNSIYIKLADRPGIYHVEAPSVSLENATLLDLIESQIFSLKAETITAFQIYKGQKKSPPQMELIKKGNDWVDEKGNLLAREKINDYFQEVAALKSSYIIDKPTEGQKKQIAALSRNPQLIFSVGDNANNTIDYSISPMVKELSDLDLKNEEYFLVSVSTTNTHYLMKKENLDLLNKKTDAMKLPMSNTK